MASKSAFSQERLQISDYRASMRESLEKSVLFKDWIRSKKKRNFGLAESQPEDDETYEEMLAEFAEDAASPDNESGDDQATFPPPPTELRLNLDGLMKFVRDGIVINLEAALNSKIEELAAVGARHAQLEEKYMKTIEHNRLFSSTVRDLDISLKSARSARKNLSAESKAGVIDFDAEIAKARELELAAKSGLPSSSDAPSPSSSGSEFSGTEEESEDDDVEG
ncbi:uncharacterized protein [Nicotiana tomentosiformis]|uniref:uncharacterized protein n=1 Tax=Nicotiana tomentosiformis TaxID=4098 RepID=UPI00388C7C99